MNSGCPVTFAVLLPNLAFLFFPPRNIPKPIAGSRTSSRMLIRIIERLGQAGAFLIPFFYQIELEGKIGSLAVALIALAIYYAGWTRYIIRGRTYELLFSSLFGIPLPMAVCPVVYFAAWSFLFNSWSLAAATLLLAIGHINVSNKERKRSS